MKMFIVTHPTSTPTKRRQSLGEEGMTVFFVHTFEASSLERAKEIRDEKFPGWELFHQELMEEQSEVTAK